MSLVQYPDSDSDDTDEANTVPAHPLPTLPGAPAKRKLSDSAQDALPPLPAAFHDLYSTNARVSTSDNPSLHGGRKRAIPHAEGTWPSHLYLEWIPSQIESDGLHSLIQHVRDALQKQNQIRTKKLPIPDIIPSLQSELGAPLPLHVSLSRTLPIQTQDREPFLKTLKSSLQRAAVCAFNFNFQSLKWVPNYDRNRWFLVLGIVQPPQDELNRLLNACNEATVSCGHPGLYTGGHGDGPMEKNAANSSSKRRKSEQTENILIDRSEYFHISIAWNLEEPDADWISLVRDIDVKKYVQQPQAAFSAVKARIGNVVHNLDLRERRSRVGLGGGIMGLD